jgi:hypothetical protein
VIFRVNRFSTRAEIEQLSYALLEPLFPVTKGIRLLGMTLSSLGEKQPESEPQLSLPILSKERAFQQGGA